MAAGFGALRDQDIGAGFGGAQRFGNFPGHMHHFATGVMGALKIVAQVLFFARPGEGGDRRAGAQCDREHVFLDLKQEVIDAEGFVGALMNGGDLVLQRRSVERRGAERAEAAGVGHRGDQRRGGGAAHAAEHDGMVDAEQIANARVNHDLSYPNPAA